MGQCIIIKNRWGSFKAYIDVIATPGSTVTATLGTTVYSGTAAASTGIVHFTVKKRGTYTITSNATNTQTATVDVEERNEIYYATIVGAFTLSLTNATGSSISANRTSSGLGGGSTGALTNGATIYYGDVITITAGNSNSTVYNNPTLTVNSATFTSGGSHTVTGDVTARTTNSVKSFTITVSKGANTNLSLKKASSPYAGSAVGTTYTASFTAYYGDTFTVTASAATNYNLSTLKWGSTSISSGSTQTATGAVTVSTTAVAKTPKLYLYQEDGKHCCTITLKQGSIGQTVQNAANWITTSGNIEYFNGITNGTVITSCTYSGWRVNDTSGYPYFQIYSDKDNTSANIYFVYKRSSSRSTTAIKFYKPNSTSTYATISNFTVTETTTLNGDRNISY